MTETDLQFLHSSIRIGERIASQFILWPEDIATFARLSGDLNPLHHDETYAQKTRFGGVIASGPQLTSLMMGLIATYFSRDTAMLGLEFTFHFRKAVRAGETIHMEWEIASAESKVALHGVLVNLDGKVTNKQGQIVLTGKGKVLVTAQL